MKVVKSTDELKRMALARGVSASVGKTRFNLASVKSSEAPKVEPKIDQVAEPVEEPIKAPDPTPEPPKEPPAPQVQPAQDLAPIVQCAVDAMAASVSEVAKDNARVMDAVVKAVARISAPSPINFPEQVTPEPSAKHWRLKVNRDTRGIMETVDIVRIE